MQADDIDGTLAQIQKVVEAATGRALSFEVDEEEKDLIVTVKADDGEVIRQIPSKEIVELRKRLEDLVGVFMDESAKRCLNVWSLRQLCAFPHWRR